MEKRRSRSERRASGEARRAEAPLSAHAELPIAPEGRDPVGLLRAQEDEREPELVPLRYERMTASPFAFLRGAATVMAHDLARTPTSSIEVQLCGDAHVANFGMFAAPDRRLVFDLNDFDETWPGPFEWDVKRLAASVVVAGRATGAKAKRLRRAAAATVASYRTTVGSLAAMAPLQVWYARVDVDDLVERLRATSLRDEARSASKASRRNSGDVAVQKLTEVVDGRHRFRHKPPLLVPVDPDAQPAVFRRAAALHTQYLESLRDDAQVLLRRFALVGLAQKVVGVGSVGTRALVMLLESGDGDMLLLQVKQAGRSVLTPYLTEPDVRHEGQRVVVGQRLMQATGDPFLGWARGTIPPRRDYYVRQLRDLKGGFDLEAFDVDRLTVYGRLCGAVLARAHARAGDPAVVSGYLGTSEEFDHAVADFAIAYADRTEADFSALAAYRATRVA
ncbi:DUF2252 domain-containing protein [Nocardioides mesophilus]|uniref:DUF2252 domain-containing protein n=2 Tax=Nocardioides mesophilus TaxID=433659 RepID=A0A7G9RHK0_9ACTN|nr:DUF2252 domain-containing protein [Nocardioides mesophilus]